MQVQPSSVRGVEIMGPGDAAFEQAIFSLLGRTPGEALKAALPYSVIVRNNDPAPLALIGVRFDMAGRGARSFSVVHYADMLRYADKSAVTQGTMRFICAEPLYTDMVLRGANDVSARGPMNLAKLRAAGDARASLDCAAFADGRFAGPDSLGAFERLAAEREAELAFVADVLRPDCDLPALIARAAGPDLEKGPRALARKLSVALEVGGREEALAHARNHRVRIELRREL